MSLHFKTFGLALAVLALVSCRSEPIPHVEKKGTPPAQGQVVIYDCEGRRKVEATFTPPYKVTLAMEGAHYVLDRARDIPGQSYIGPEGNVMLKVAGNEAVIETQRRSERFVSRLSCIVTDRETIH